MKPNNGESRKRKGKEPVGASEAPADPNPLRFAPACYRPKHEHERQPLFPSSHISTELRLSSQITHSNNANTNAYPDLLSAAFKPPAFTSLVNGAEEPDHLPALVRDQNGHIDQLITTQGNQLRRTIAEAQRRQYILLMQEADERAAKRLREKEAEREKMAKRLREREAELLKERFNNVELQQQAYTVRQENQLLRRRVSDLEEKVDNIALLMAAEEEEGESARVDEDRLEPMMMECRVCAWRRAAVALWPCRHVCLCSTCEPATGRCPVCDAVKNFSLEVTLPR